MRLGVEQALFDSGLAAKLRRSFGMDTGIVVELIPASSAATLSALEQGEIDMSMTNAPELEIDLVQQGLAHDHQLIAEGDLVLVGPVTRVGKKMKDPAGMLGVRDIVAALSLFANGQTRFISAGEGSGAHLAEQTLWNSAQVIPTDPWYSMADSSSQVLAQAATQGAYTLVERNLWLSNSIKPLGIVVEGDPRMKLEIHVLQSFRNDHPATKLFGKWLTDRAGRRVINSVGGWRAASR